MTALRALLGGIVDYAGLFPPAALDMPAAVRSYAAYRAQDEAWMLGRFVVPTARLDEFAAALGASRASAVGEWRLAALLGENVTSDFERIRAFNIEHRGGARIDVVEGRLSSADAIDRAATAARASSSGDEVLTLFAELPIEADPRALIDAVKRSGVNAKVRTGGVTPEAIPDPRDVLRFIRACVDARVPFKATAGLHHPLRAEHSLTYAADAPHAEMFGFLNVFLVAAFLEFGMSDADALRLLGERDPSAFTISSDAIAWGDRRLSAAQIRVARDVVAISFGSCSFREPVDDLRALSFLS